jgi:hypothetical protein
MIVAVAAALTLTGCRIPRPDRPKVVNSYLAEPEDLANVRRIMVLPFHAEHGVTVDNNQIRDAFVGELQKLRRFEVVPLTDAAREDDMLNLSLSHGRLSTDAMVRLCERYSLDGVFVGSVTSYRAYTPPHLGLRTHLISVHSGATIWAVDAIYDAADLSTVSDLRHYVDRTQRDDGNLHGWELTLLSPAKFTNFVAHRCVGTWIEG